MKLEHAWPHAVPVAELRARIEARVAEYAARHPHVDLAHAYRWTSDTSAEASYRGGSGRLAFTADRVTVVLELPFFARVFKARIEEFLEAEYRHLTGPR